MTFLDRLGDPRHRQFYDYWNGKRAGRSMPRRRDIDPIDIPQLLLNIMIAEVVGSRFRFRLIGSAIVEAFGTNSTGKFLDEICSGGYRDFITGVYRTVCAEKRPVFAESEFATSKGYSITARRLFLPLSEDDRSVDRIVALHLFQYRSAAPAVIELDRSGDAARHKAEVMPASPDEGERG